MNRTNYSVDDYIDDFSFNPSIQERLNMIRTIAKKVFPNNIIETIYHGVPTFMLNGKDIFNYGAYKKHITLFIGYDCIDLVKARYPLYQYSKAAMMINNNDDFLSEMIENICYIIIENI